MKAAVVTVSDSRARGLREDTSGPALAELLTLHGWKVVDARLVPDGVASVRAVVEELTERGDLDLLVTTGGTGVSPRDLTPEAVRPLLEKELPGLGELMRSRGIESTPYAVLSRSLGGVRKGVLVVCLPGSLRGATESLEAVLQVLPHAVELAKEGE